MSRPLAIIPSVLPADFSRLGEQVEALDAAGVDRFQFDVMDGHFVPNLTFGPDVIASVRDRSDKVFEAHLMVSNPDVMLGRYVEAGCDQIIIHTEAATHLHRSLDTVRELGCSAAVALNPATPIEAVVHVLELVDMVLVMTVNPGFGGQSYISEMQPKIAALKAEVISRGLDIDIEVDGGINTATVAGAVSAGANYLVCGSGLFRDPKGLTHAVSELRSIAQDAAEHSAGSVDGDCELR